MEKNKIIKIFKLIVIAIFVISIILILKKAVILKSIYKKSNKSFNINNYHSLYYNYENSYIEIIETYKKDNKQITRVRDILKKTGELSAIHIEYWDGEKCNCYSEIFDDEIEEDLRKTVKLNTKRYFSEYRPEKINSMNYNNTIDFILSCLFGKIESTKCNGKECYKFTNLAKQVNNEEIYIDKETGLPVRRLGEETSSNLGTYNKISDYYIEFNCVNDEDLKEPNIREYTIQNN